MPPRAWARREIASLIRRARRFGSPHAAQTRITRVRHVFASRTRAGGALSVKRRARRPFARFFGEQLSAANRQRRRRSRPHVRACGHVIPRASLMDASSSVACVCRSVSGMCGLRCGSGSRGRPAKCKKMIVCLTLRASASRAFEAARPRSRSRARCVPILSRECEVMCARRIALTDGCTGA